MFSAIANKPNYPELDSGYNIDKIQSNLDSVDKKKLKMVNIVDATCRTNLKSIFSVSILDVMAKDERDIDTILNDIDYINSLFQNPEIHKYYPEWYNKIIDSPSKTESKNLLTLEELLELSDQEKKEMILLFINRLTFHEQV